MLDFIFCNFPRVNAKPVHICFGISRAYEDAELQKDSTKYRIKKDGKKHTLIIHEATLDDVGMYHAWTNGGHTKGELEVEGTKTSCIILFCPYLSFERLKSL